MSKAIAEMTSDELVAENQRLQREEDAIRTTKREIKAELDARAATEETERLLAGLSPGQRDAVARAAQAHVTISPTTT